MEDLFDIGKDNIAEIIRQCIDKSTSKESKTGDL